MKPTTPRTSRATASHRRKLLRSSTVHGDVSSGLSGFVTDYHAESPCRRKELTTGQQGGPQRVRPVLPVQSRSNDEVLDALTFKVTIEPGAVTSGLIAGDDGCLLG